MEPQGIIRALTTYADRFPREALEAAIADPAAITPHQDQPQRALPLRQRSQVQALSRQTGGLTRAVT